MYKFLNILYSLLTIAVATIIYLINFIYGSEGFYSVLVTTLYLTVVGMVVYRIYKELSA